MTMLCWRLEGEATAALKKLSVKVSPLLSSRQNTCDFDSALKPSSLIGMTSAPLEKKRGSLSSGYFNATYRGSWYHHNSLPYSIATTYNTSIVLLN